MKQLTRNEVVELIARTIISEINKAETGGEEVSFDMFEEEDKQGWLGIACGIAQALETNGILCLVEGEAKEGDEGKDDFHQCFFKNNKWNTCYGVDVMGVVTIDKRNSIPAYHCKPETQGAE